MRPQRICMFVYNVCRTDARVLKEASSLAAAGHEVVILAVADGKLPAEEERDGFRIVRIQRDPPHYKVLRAARRGARWRRLTIARARRRARIVRLRARRLLARPRRRAARLRRLAVARARLLARIVRLRLRRILRRPALRAARRVRLARARARRLGRRVERSVRLARARARRLGRRVERSVRLGRARALRMGRPLRRWLRRSRRLSRRIGRRVRRVATPSVVRPPSVADDTVVATPADAPATSRQQAPPAAEPTADAGGELGAIQEPATAPPRGGRRGRRAGAPRQPAWRRALMYFHKPLMFGDFYVRAFGVARALNADGAHAHDLNTLPVAAALARVDGLRLVYDAHELYTEISTLSPRERAIWRWIERALIGRADHVITVCRSIADELVERYGVDEPVIVLNCPARPADEPSRSPNRLREHAGLDSGAPIVLYQGGFTPHRGLEELVEAASHFDRGVLVLMGWGVMEATLAQLVDDLDLGERVRIVGPVAQADLLAHTAGADVGVIPYKAVGLNNFYTTPNKLFEYIAAGVPIAGSRFPELVRFVEGMGLGRTFDPREPREIAAAVNALLADPAEHAAIRERVAAAAGSFTWEHQEEALLRTHGGPVARDVRVYTRGAT